jgi:sugar lactone lactonase YvrE
MWIEMSDKPNLILKISSTFLMILALTSICVPLTYIGKAQALTYMETYNYTTQWGSSGSGNGQFGMSRSIAIDSLGNVYLADRQNHRIQKFSSDGLYLSQWGSLGNGNGQFGEQSPIGVGVDNSGNVYVADWDNFRTMKFSDQGTFLTLYGGNYSTIEGLFLWDPSDVAVDNSGNVYIVDSGNYRIQKFYNNGTFLAQWGAYGNANGKFIYPYGIAVDNLGNVYVTDGNADCVQKFTSNGIYLAKWGTQGNGNSQFVSPRGITVDASGNVYVADAGNNRIQKFSSDGAYITQWGGLGTGNGQFNSPFDVAIDSLGNAYVVDTGNNRIQKFAMSYTPDPTLTPTPTPSPTPTPTTTLTPSPSTSLTPTPTPPASPSPIPTQTPSSSNSPIPTDTTQSTLYTNTAFGFSIKPPTGWIISEENYGAEVMFTGPYIPDTSGHVTFGIDTVKANGALAEYASASKLAMQSEFQNFQLLSERTEKIAGYECRIIVASFTTQGLNFKAEQVNFVENGNRFLFTFATLTSYFDKYAPVFIEMVQSFQLSNLETTESITNLSLKPIGDTFVTSGEPDGTRGSKGSLCVSNFIDESGAIVRGVVFIKFDLSSVPKTAKISSATLNLARVDFDHNPLRVSAYQCLDNSWTESKLTYSNMPAFNATAMDSVIVSVDKKWYSWNVIDAIKASLNGNKIVTVVLTAPELNSWQYGVETYYWTVTFGSKENAPLAPSLTIGFTPTQYPSPSVPEFSLPFFLLIFTFTSFLVLVWNRKHINGHKL